MTQDTPGRKRSVYTVITELDSKPFIVSVVCFKSWREREIVQKYFGNPQKKYGTPRTLGFMG